MISSIIDELFSDSIKKTTYEQRLNDGDYIEKGVLHCSNCKTPKECIVDFLGKIRKFPCLCRCQREAVEQEQKERELKAKIEELKRQGIADPVFMEWTFEKDDNNTQNMKYAKKYVDNWEDMLKNNIGLILSGAVGTGKTFMASCIGNAIILKLYPVLMTSFPRLLNEVTTFKENRNDFLNRLNKFSLLIIDDLGVERQSDFTSEVIYQIVDFRYKLKLPIIVTTNIPINELKSTTDIKLQRIYDRLLEICLPIQVQGKNRRLDIARNKMELAKNLFNE